MTPLGDIRVLSVTVYLSGPFLSMTLARFGADVIKVEMPGVGDPSRNVGPYAGPEGVHPDRQTDEDMSVRFLKRSEGVKSVTLDLKQAQGRELFLKLAEQSDVIVENLSPGSMTRMGLGYDEVAKVNPRIIYCSIAGYGQTGPYKDLPAHDHQIQAMAGIMDMNGDPEGPPTRIGVFVGDLVTPLYAAYSILGALRVREQTGRGQHLDASMIDTLATLMFMEPVEFALDSGAPPRAGNGSRNGLTGLYHLTDGDMIITAGGEKRWRGLCTALGLDAMLEDPRYASNAGRETHIDVIKATIAEKLSHYSCADGIELMQSHGIPAAKVRTLAEAIEDDHFRDRGTIKPMRRIDANAPVEGGIVAGFPIKFSGGELPAVEGSAPLGHHNDEIYESPLGLDSHARQQLKEQGII